MMNCWVIAYVLLIQPISTSLVDIITAQILKWLWPHVLDMRLPATYGKMYQTCTMLGETIAVAICKDIYMYSVGGIVIMNH